MPETTIERTCHQCGKVFQSKVSKEKGTNPFDAPGCRL